MYKNVMIYELKEELIMILNNQIITDIKIDSVNDLYKLTLFFGGRNIEN